MFQVLAPHAGLQQDLLMTVTSDWTVTVLQHQGDASVQVCDTRLCNNIAPDCAAALQQADSLAVSQAIVVRSADSDGGVICTVYTAFVLPGWAFILDLRLEVCSLDCSAVGQGI